MSCVSRIVCEIAQNKKKQSGKRACIPTNKTKAFITVKHLTVIHVRSRRFSKNSISVHSTGADHYQFSKIVHHTNT